MKHISWYKTINFGLYFVIFLSIINTNLLAKDITFLEGNWEIAKTVATTENKPIFVQIYGKNCGFCLQIEQAFSESKYLTDYYNKYFVNYKVILDTPEGNAFKEAYQVKSLPTLLYFRPDGELVLRTKGSSNVLALLTDGENARHTFAFNLESMRRQYESGFKKVGFLHDYAYLLKQNGEPYQVVVKDYIDKRGLKKGKISTLKDLKFIFFFADQTTSPAFKVLLKSKTIFNKIYTEQAVNRKIQELIIKDVNEAILKKNSKLFQRALKLTKKAGLPDSKAFLQYLTDIYHASLKDSESGDPTDELEQFPESKVKVRETSDQAILLYEKAMQMTKGTDSIKDFEEAKTLLATSIKHSSEFYNNEGYAYVLLQLGEVEEALKAAKKAVNIGQQSGIDCSTLLQMLNQHYYYHGSPSLDQIAKENNSSRL